ncbi:PilC/PilY family type IV pilus protein [Desulfobacterales bacterium HSG16]|nr:PilC/PilY family type IV pilus protein [Desulfobacterales bacterium HSG16]
MKEMYKIFKNRYWLIVMGAVFMALFMASTASAFEVIIDNSGPNFEKKKKWSDSSGTPFYGGTKAIYTEEKDAKAIWKPAPALPEGLYEVFASWPYYYNRNTAASYTIKSGAVNETVTRNQRGTNGTNSGWVSLGTYYFDGSSKSKVELKHKKHANGNSCADAVKFVSAVAKPPNTITSSAQANGNITPSGDVSVEYLDDKSFTIEPDAGYAVEDVLVDGASEGAISSYLFMDVDTDHTIEAKFKKVNQIDVIVNGNGEVSPAGPLIKDIGTDVTFDLTPGIDQVLTSVTIDGVQVVTSPKEMISEVSLTTTGDHTVEVTFGPALTDHVDFTDDFETDKTRGNVWALFDNDREDGTYVMNVNGELHIMAEGRNTWNQYDEYAALYMNDISGDFIATVKVLECGKGGNYPKAGIMIRNDMSRPGSSSGSGYITATKLRDTGLRLYYDKNDNGTLDSSAYSKDMSGPFWIKVKKEGKTFTMYTSSDNISYVEKVDKYINSANSVQDVGLYYTAASGSAMGLARFDDFSITRIPNYTITTTVQGGGSIDPSGSVSVKAMQNQLFSIKPDTGYAIEDVLIDGVSVGVASSYNFTKVIDDHTIKAVFKEIVPFSEAIPFCDDFSGTMNPLWNKHDGENVSGTSIGTQSGKMVINAGGEGMWSSNGGQDEFGAAFLSDVEGGFEATVKVTSFDPSPSVYAKAGIMIRNSVLANGTAEGAGYAVVAVQEQYGFTFRTDSDDDGILNKAENTDVNYKVPVWLKLKKNNEKFTAYYSYQSTGSSTAPSDSSDWTQIGGEKSIGSAASKQDVGLFVSSNKDGVLTQGSFDNFCMNHFPVEFWAGIEPSGAITDGAKWRLLVRNNSGGYESGSGSFSDWHDSLDTVEMQYGTDVKIEWKEATGWILPPDEEFTVPDASFKFGYYSKTPSSTTTTTTRAGATTTTTLSRPGPVCSDISSIPLEAKVKAAPARVFFVLDDSGSMAWSFMTKTGSEGRFNIYGGTKSDVFNMGDYHKAMWKSQWYGFNQIYYNPAEQYSPWAYKDDADSDYPKKNPEKSSTQDLNAVYLKFVNESDCRIVDNSDSNFSRKDGSWTHNSDSDRGYLRDYYKSGTSGNHKAVWTVPGDLEAGDYRVYAWWYGKGDEYHKTTPYKITYSGGSATVNVDQEKNGHAWNRLGDAGTTYKFTGSSSENVTLELRTSDGGRVCADAVKFANMKNAISIPYSHYYVTSTDGSIYLVTLLSGSAYYYKVTESLYSGDEGESHKMYVSELTEVTDPPEGVKVEDYATARQNFANWYSYYRTRELSAKGAVGKMIVRFRNVYIGMLGLNKSKTSGVSKQVVLPVNVEVGGTTLNETAALLDYLYADIGASGGTPLRRGLEKAGEYFDMRPPRIDPDPSPWSQDEGAECMQVFTIAMTDGFYNGGEISRRNPYGYTDVGNTDGDGDTAYDGGAFKDSKSNKLADFAMEYYENDINPDLPDHQKMVTFTISFGLNGYLTPNIACHPDQTGAENCPDDWWPNGDSGQLAKIDDMWHAAINGRGEYLNANNSTELQRVLDYLVNIIDTRTKQTASVKINSQRLQSGAKIYKSTYESEHWSGDLRAYPLNEDSGAVENKIWSAAEKLKDRTEARNIFTSSGGSKTGVKFEWGSLTSTQQAKLFNTDRMVQFLRGDRDLETKHINEIDGPVFRERDADQGRLGDIVHSFPLIHKDTQTVYVGANDGMLHAFNTEDGEERFAYIPNLVFDNLPLLGLTFYTHEFFVDVAPVVKLVGAQYLLVGGLGKGGKGYYGLDVTTPDSFSADKVLWEFPSPAYDSSKGFPISADPDMGYSYSRAYIVPSNADKEVVIFANGYDSNSQKAVLFVLDPLTGTELARIPGDGDGDGRNGAGAFSGGDTCNGLSQPVVIDSDLDGDADYAYAGDLMGNMWKFDLTDSSIGNWHVSYNGKPLFTAKNDAGDIQSITGKPDVMDHCVDNKKGRMVVFGTGKYLGASDLANTGTQSLYGIWDWEDEWVEEGDNGDDKEFGEILKSKVEPSCGNPNLKLRQLSNFAGSGTSSNLIDGKQLFLQHQEFNSTGSDRKITNYEMDWYYISSKAGCHLGWSVDLPMAGERVISEVTVRGGDVIFVSIVPTNDSCAVQAGLSMLQVVNACNGGIPDTVFSPAPGEDPTTTVEVDRIMSPPAIIQRPDKDTDLVYTGDETPDDPEEPTPDNPNPPPPPPPPPPGEVTQLESGMTHWREHER